ncbi:MAG: helix-turn-helix domain-containing protein [Chlorobiaceae bacterium]|nr:helix-turn-helix domain-containing protein [Chlorobiaceae bacterium]
MDDLTYQPVKHNHEEFLREEMKDEEFRKGYEALGPKYSLIRQLLLARQQSGMTQEAIANKIGTTKSAISRLESGGKHVPSITTLRKYADAVGCDLEIKLTPKNLNKTAG